MSNKPEIEGTKEVWVAWSNTDCTEGRGTQYPLLVAESYETAVRMGQKKYVMGTDCPVTKETAVKVHGHWMVPSSIYAETAEDKEVRLKREAREAAITKAKAAGLTDEDIASLASR